MKNIFKSMGYILVYFVIQFLMQFALMMSAAISQGIESETVLMNYSAERLLLMTILANLLMVLVCGVYFKLRKRNIAAEVRAAKVGVQSYIMPVILAFSFSFAWAMVTYNVTFDNSTMIIVSAYHYSNWVPYLGEVLKVVALLISAPVTEEFVCRGILIPKLEKSHSPLIAVMISAVAFGLMHLMAGGVILALGATLMGVVFGFIYVKTKSLWPAIAAHMFANLPDFIIPLFGTLSPLVRWGLFVVFAAIFAICMVRFLKKSR